MSNCLLQALRYRLKGCPIYYVRPTKRVRKLPHFIWWDRNLGSYRHYTDRDTSCTYCHGLMYEGYVDNFPYEKLKVKLIRIL